MRPRVSSDSRGLPRSARLTVFLETPAARAMSDMEGMEGAGEGV